MEEYKREYCCSNCGLIWFGEYPREKGCPECSEETGIYACDTFGFIYATDGIKEKLKVMNKAIHYAKDHPYFNK